MKHFLLLFICLLVTAYVYSQCIFEPSIMHTADVAFPIPDECMTAEHDESGKPYLYVAGKERGLLIYDVSGIIPVLVDSITVNMLDTMELMNISQNGNYLYLALGNVFVKTSKPGMAIVDVTNPATPVLKSVWKYPTQSGGAGIVKAEGNYAYLGAMRRGLMILDITNKSSVSLLSIFKPDISYPNPTSPDSLKYNARGLEVRNSMVYLCDDAGGFRIIDASNKLVPTETGRYSNATVYNKARAYNNVVLADTIAFVAADYCGMEILNISNPTSISAISWWNPWRCDSTSNNWFNSPGYANELRYDSNCKMVFLSTGRGEVHGVSVYNITHPDSCIKYTTTGSTEGTWGIGLYNSQIYACYIYYPIAFPFSSSWSGVKVLKWTSLCGDNVPKVSYTPTFTMYPNPATNSDVNINVAGCKGACSISVSDITGRKIMERIIQPGETTIQLAVSDFAPGNYIVAIQYGSQHIFKNLSIIK